MSPLLQLLFLLEVWLVLLQSAGGSDVPSIHLEERALNPANSASCATSSSWQNTPSAWRDANTDSFLKTFLATITPDKPFDRTLGNRYGPHYSAFKCGIGLYSSCMLPACTDYQDTSEERSAYFTTVAMGHLATKFNILHDAMTNGQLDYQGVIDDLADNFFHWKDPEFIGDDIAAWVTASITVAFSILTLGLGTPLVAASVVGTGTFLGAATTEAQLSLSPPQGLLRSSGISYLKKTLTQFGESSRHAIELWANNTFNGVADSRGHTIADYFYGGGFLSDVAMPSSSDAEKYYKTSMIAKTVNGQWRTKANYLMFASTNDRNVRAGPESSRYYSDVRKGIYNAYNLDSSTSKEPTGLSLLGGPAYGILPWQVTKASARAWETAGNNYTDEKALSRIQDSFTSNGTLTPFQDGPAWEGTFTLPVCDVGTHVEWLTEYGGKGLPCCCGPNCVDTAAFVRAANLNHSKALLKGCRALLRDTLLNFDGIDYGVETQSGFIAKWHHEWSTGQKAGICIGIIVGSIVAACVLIGFCICLVN